MTVLNFPSSPSVDDTYEENGVVYTWDGTKWTANSTRSFLPIEGGTLTGNLTVPSLNGGPLAGFRNQIINGDFRVWQRGTSLTFNNSERGYGADRWAHVFVFPGNDATYTRVTDHGFAGHTYACRYSTTTDLDNFMVHYPVELDAEGFAGKFTGQWTLSWISSAQPKFAQIAYADDAIPTNRSDFWTQDAAGIVSLGNNRYSATFTADATPNATNKCALLTFAPPSGTSWDLTGVQLEPGPVATPFEHRPIGTELALCQRYYETGEYWMQASGSLSSMVGARIDYKVSKRALPAVTSPSPIYGGAASLDMGPSLEGFGFYATADGSGRVRGPWRADAEL